MADIDATNTEFQVAGRVFSAPQFFTPNGRAQLIQTPLSELKFHVPNHFGGMTEGGRGFVLNLMTVRSHGQHNTVVYKAADWYRVMPHRQTLLISFEDWQ